MRRVIQLMLLLSLITCLYACKKDKLTSASITGSWELREIYSSNTGVVSFPAGNGSIYTFNSDGTFTQYERTDSVVNHGNYVVKQNAVNINDVSYNELLLNGAQSGQVVQVQDSTLSLGLNYNGGAASIYSRIK